MQLLLLTVQLKVYRMIVFTESFFEHFVERSRSLKILFLHKIINDLSPLNLQSCITVGKDFIKPDQLIKLACIISTRTQIFRSSFFPYCIEE